jgi:hypothetical protein
MTWRAAVLHTQVGRGSESGGAACARRVRSAAAWATAMAMLGLPWLPGPLGIAPLQAQVAPPSSQEVRADVIAGRNHALQLGVAHLASPTYNVRLGVTAAGGVQRDEGRTRLGGRVDAVARLLLDPFREVPLGVSLGGGLSVANVQQRGWRPYLVAVLDVEGPRRADWVPAVQLGVGGGVRVGASLRRAHPRWR